MHVKHCIVIYVFLDLAGLLESRRYVWAYNDNVFTNSNVKSWLTKLQWLSYFIKCAMHFTCTQSA
jgi:hypothetical protein